MNFLSLSRFWVLFILFIRVFNFELRLTTDDGDGAREPFAQGVCGICRNILQPSLNYNSTISIKL